MNMMESVKDVLIKYIEMEIVKQKILEENYKQWLKLDKNMKKIRDKNYYKKFSKDFDEIKLNITEYSSSAELQLLLNAINSDCSLKTPDIYISIMENINNLDENVAGIFENYLMYKRVQIENLYDDVDFYNKKDLKKLLIEMIESTLLISESIHVLYEETAKKINIKKTMEIYKNDNLSIEKETGIPYYLLNDKCNVSKIKKLLEFIKNSDDFIISSKYINTFNNMFLVDKKDKLLFRKYCSCIVTDLKDKKHPKQIKIVKKEILPVKIKPEELKIKDEELKSDISEFIQVEKIEKEYIILDESRKIYDNILNRNRVSDIELMLPKIENPQFYKIYADLEMLLKGDIEASNELNNEFDQTSDFESDDEDYINKELTRLKASKAYLEKFKQEEINKNQEIKIVKEKKFQLFFTKNSTGEKVNILENLEDLDYNYSDGAEELLYALITELENNESFNIEKSRKLSGNNKFKYMLEIKGWKLRLIYRHIKGNNYFVNGVYIKKADNDRKLYERANEKFKASEKEYEQIKEMIKNGNIPNELIEESDAIFEECFKIVGNVENKINKSF